MARKSKTQQLTEDMLGRHLGLPVAAHLARSQLVPDAHSVYDSRHISDMLNVIAAALARTAPLYVRDSASGERRELVSGELEGAVAKGSASMLVLKDGRTLAGVTIRRADLRQAIALLKAVGLPIFGSRVPASTKSARSEIDALCDECHALVGAGPAIPRHPGLHPATLQKEERRKHALVCAQCHSLWRLGPLGWARMVTDTDADE